MQPLGCANTKAAQTEEELQDLLPVLLTLPRIVSWNEITTIFMTAISKSLTENYRFQPFSPTSLSCLRKCSVTVSAYTYLEIHPPSSNF